LRNQQPVIEAIRTRPHAPTARTEKAPQREQNAGLQRSDAEIHGDQRRGDTIAFATYEREIAKKENKDYSHEAARLCRREAK
jgi:hypothetical protein